MPEARKYLDFFGKPLETGFYLQQGFCDRIYFVKLSEDGQDFSVEDYTGEIYNNDAPIKKIDIAKTFIKLSNPKRNLEFAISKLPLSDIEKIIEDLDAE